MPITLEGAAVGELIRALESCSVSFPGIRVVCDALPGRAICAATIVDGTLWVVLDLDKPSAPRHAIAMLREAKARLCTEGDDLLLRRLDLSPRAPLALVG